jgi:hypothetical protein
MIKSMTAQFTEQILLHGHKRALCTDPLESYFEMSDTCPKFEVTCTALWRGYVGTWEILNDRLYLVDLDAVLMTGQIANIATIFPGFPERAFAHWYSGTLRIPMGELLRYVHGGYGSVYERDQFITIRKGMSGATSQVVNGEVSGSDASEDAYAVHAMCTFSSESKDRGSPK